MTKITKMTKKEKIEQCNDIWSNIIFIITTYCCEFLYKSHKK
jgi:hypothetical protein